MKSVLERLNEIEKRLAILEGITVGVPLIPPPLPPAPSPPHVIDDYDYELDMSVSNHVDVKMDAGETITVRFIFTEPGVQSLTHLTAVDLITGPCFKMAVPALGYESKHCRVEMSVSLATDGKYKSWVVPKNEYVYLQIINTGGKGTMRLRWNGENAY